MNEVNSHESPASNEFPPATRGEILAWAAYDIANSTYATVVCTAVYNAYFVNEIAAHVPGMPKSYGTVLLTAVISISALLVVLTAPIIGTICDAKAAKKSMLLISTVVCILATGALMFVQPGQYIAAMTLMITANVAFFTGEDLIAAFLPELAHKNDMGRISSIGWAAGYVGGLFSLGACALYMWWAAQHGQTPVQYVPMTMAVCAVYFAITVTPTFIWMRERAVPDPEAATHNPILIGFARLKQTIVHTRHYRDLFNFLLCLFVYSCGTLTIVHLASVYAQQVFHFSAKDIVMMISMVNVTAAVGAVAFGFVQDKIGSIRTLAMSLVIWLLAIVVTAAVEGPTGFWWAGNLVGLAMGATGSVGRALVGQFSPPGRSGEFLGLWGFAVKLATCVGAISFGSITYLTGSNYRLALLSTGIFIVGGLILLSTINEERGKKAALTEVE